VLDAGVDAALGVPFIVMELLRGEDLGRLLARHGALEPTVGARLVAQACEGLESAHARGLVHRDVKPSNLFLHELASGLVEPKLCDFGAAKWTVTPTGAGPHEDVTCTGHVIGSPQFMSPEQALGTQEVDARSDVWSLGVTLFCALTGRSPWPGQRTVAELLVAICTAQLPHIQDAAPWLATGLAQVVHRALRRRPEERFASAGELALALEPFAAPGSVSIGMLAGLRPGTRARIEGRAAGPESVTADAVGLSHTVADVASGRTRTRLRRWALVVCASSLVGGIAAWHVSRNGADQSVWSSRLVVDMTRRTVPEVVGWAASARGAADRTRASVTIQPADAAVHVDGVAVRLANGTVTLVGEPGDRFVIELSRGKLSARQAVVLTKLGTAEPNVIAIGEGGAHAARHVPPGSSALSAAVEGSADRGP
jgi:serine/threonine-protein kinase